MALKAKNDEEDELFEDENSKFKSYITRQFKKFIKNVYVKAKTRIASSLGFLNLSLKINSRENPKKVDKVATFQLVQNAIAVKGTDTWSMNVLSISSQLARAKS